MNYNTEFQSNNTDLRRILDTINSLPPTISLPELDKPAAENEVFANQEYIDAAGLKKVGTFTLEAEKTQQDNLIEQLKTILASKARVESVEMRGTTLRIR